MMSSTYSLPWGSSSSSSPKSAAGVTPSPHKDDSAFHEEPEHSNSNNNNHHNKEEDRHCGHEYSNPESSYESGYNPSSSTEEPEYSNTSGSSDSCPDYEEVTDQERTTFRQMLQHHQQQQQQQQQRPKGLVYNLASEGIFHCQRAQTHGGDMHLDGSSDLITKEKIMNSLIYCIHKVIIIIWLFVG